MRVFRQLVAWMDRYWEARDYSPVFAHAQRLVWGAPLIAALVLMAVLESVGVERNSPVISGALILGFTGTFLMLGLSLYRWMAGYSRSDWQDRQAKEHRANTAAQRSKSRPPLSGVDRFPADEVD